MVTKSARPWPERVALRELRSSGDPCAKCEPAALVGKLSEHIVACIEFGTAAESRSS